ncbi:MAG: succinate dehydrogenase/fumarate reductase iron-sulfur subunit [Alkalispirochaeta sp.]
MSGREHTTAQGQPDERGSVGTDAGRSGAEGGSTPTQVVFRIHRAQREPSVREYTVEVEPHTTVVDALELIRHQQDETLLFRHSCHHGSCGTCGMLVNGERKLACTTNVVETVESSAEGRQEVLDGTRNQAARGDGAGTEATRANATVASGDHDRDDSGSPSAPVIELRPLQTMRHIGDLAVDPTPLFRDFPAAASYLRESEANKGSTPPAEIEGYVRFENCIECGLCVSACPVIQIRGFMGPAGLSAYNRELDKRPERSAELLPEVDTDAGAWGCDRHLACSAVCPTGVYPAKQIAMLQRKIKKGREQDGERPDHR